MTYSEWRLQFNNIDTWWGKWQNICTVFVYRIMSSMYMWVSVYERKKFLEDFKPTFCYFRSWMRRNTLSFSSLRRCAAINLTVRLHWCRVCIFILRRTINAIGVFYSNACFSSALFHPLSLIWMFKRQKVVKCLTIALNLSMFVGKLETFLSEIQNAVKN